MSFPMNIDVFLQDNLVRIECQTWVLILQRRRIIMCSSNTVRQFLRPVYNICYNVLNKEIQPMSENEITLINLIRDHKNPEKAFVTALEIILLFLNHQEASASESSVVYRESV